MAKLRPIVRGGQTAKANVAQRTASSCSELLHPQLHLQLNQLMQAVEQYRKLEKSLYVSILLLQEVFL